MKFLHAKWEYVDFERGVMLLPDSKTGKKPIYLAALRSPSSRGLPRLEGNPFMSSPGAKDGAPRADLKKPWAAVPKAAGLEGVRLHDLRHALRQSFGAGASLGLPIIGKLLGHTQSATTARYAHLDADPMRRAADAIGATIAAAMGGGSGRDGPAADEARAQPLSRRALLPEMTAFGAVARRRKSTPHRRKVSKHTTI